MCVVYVGVRDVYGVRGFRDVCGVHSVSSVYGVCGVCAVHGVYGVQNGAHGISDIEQGVGLVCSVSDGLQCRQFVLYGTEGKAQSTLYVVCSMCCVIHSI